MRRMIASVLAAVVLMVGCGPKAAVTEPQIPIYHYGADILEANAKVQRAVTAAAQADPRNVPAARRITAGLDQVVALGDRLSGALKLVDTATGAAKVAAATDAQTIILAIEKVLTENAGTTDLVGGAAGEAIKLAANLATLVTTVKSELAKRAARQIATPPQVQNVPSLPAMAWGGARW